jgi:hypothetical protein
VERSGPPVGTLTDRGHDDSAARVMSDRGRPVIDAGLADLVDMHHRVSDELWLGPTPGDTPGHVDLRVTSAGCEARRCRARRTPRRAAAQRSKG